MTTKTDELIADLQAWCDAEHGRRAELSRILGVQYQTIRNWLARRTNPGSEETLLLLDFLANPEKFRKPGRGLK